MNDEEPADNAGALSSPGKYLAPGPAGARWGSGPIADAVVGLGRSVVGMQPDPMETSIETPIDDAVEQTVMADPFEAAADADYTEDVHRGLEVDEWDATEQARAADIDVEYD